MKKNISLILVLSIVLSLFVMFASAEDVTEPSEPITESSEVDPSTEPTEPEESTEPTETSSDPTESTEPTDPTEPTEPTEPEEPFEMNFTDVGNRDWFYCDVEFVVKNKTMKGVEDNKFSPNTAATRAMIATIFWRLEGSPVPTAPSGFSDVPAGSWFSDAIAWMKETGITNGAGVNKYGTEDRVTREELATFFYRYSAWKNEDMADCGKIMGFNDFGKINYWAVKALSWANGRGLVIGTKGNLLNPQGYATRAEIAAMLHRYMDESAAIIPADTHVHEYAVINKVEPTCTTGGYSIFGCACGMQYKDALTGALGHQMGEYVGDESTYTEDAIGFYGKQTRTCQRCGFKETKSGLIRKWEDFDIAMMEEAVLQYAIEKYHCVYEPTFSIDRAMNNHDCGFYFPDTFWAYSEEELIKEFYKQVDLTFEKRFIADQNNDYYVNNGIDTFEKYIALFEKWPCRAKVVIQRSYNYSFDCYFIYG